MSETDENKEPAAVEQPAEENAETSTTPEDREEMEGILGKKHSEEPPGEKPKGFEETAQPLEGLDKETAERLVGASESVKTKDNEKPKQEAEVDPMYDPNFPTEQAKARWAMEIPDLGPVSVTSLERDLFLKAICGEGSVSWHISLDHKYLEFNSEIKSRSTYETEIVFKCLDDDIKNKDIMSQTQYMTKMQQYCACAQFEALNGVKFEKHKIDATLQDHVYACEVLRYNCAILFGNMNDVKWLAMLTMLRTYETKLAICIKNLKNEDFWTPADSD